MCGIFHFETSPFVWQQPCTLKCQNLGVKSINNHFSNPKRIKTYNIHACNTGGGGVVLVVNSFSDAPNLKIFTF